MNSHNPLLADFSTLHSTFPFTKVSVADIKEAIEEGIRIEKEEVDAIANSNEAPTFGNTIVALTHTGKILERATTLMYNLMSAETTDELNDLGNATASMLSEHSNSIVHNEKLFGRVRQVYEQERATLSGEARMLLEKAFEGFERSGATLDERGKERFREITKKLSELTLLFSQNLLNETNNFFLHITDEQDLSGLPQLHREAAAEEAKSRNLPGWVFTLKAPSYLPFMTYADNRSLREQLYRAYHTRCTHDNAYNNFEVVRNIVSLRGELARLLGYADYADYTLRRRMAGTSEKVYEMFDELMANYREKAQKEVEEIAKKAREEESSDFELQAYDFSYYAQKLRKERFDIDPEALRPYFELEHVKKGVFGLAHKLYGITFRENKQIQVYHPDVVAYEVFDSDGSFLAVLYADFFPRKGKQGGAWMTSYQEEHSEIPVGEKVTAKNSVRPHVSITMNLTAPTGDTPSLLTLEEVKTFLHEFGHALHAIFAMTHYESLSGTSVYWDFVELPSQFMENYAVEQDFLTTFAQHYKTGESIPPSYIDRIRRSQTFNAAYACMRQISFGLLDMAYYTLKGNFTGDLYKFETESCTPAQMLPQVDGACMSVQFGHIMSGGYAAGYYSYKWAEILDADAFAAFQEHGIFNQETARRFRECILSKGGTEPPMNLYKAFRGQAPTTDALLRRDGIKN